MKRRPSARGAGRKQRVRPSATLKPRGRTLTESSISRAERELGVLFPGDYRRFLRRCNGADPDPPHFVYRDSLGAYRLIWVERLCAITSSRLDAFNLRETN